MHDLFGGQSLVLINVFFLFRNHMLVRNFCHLILDSTLHMGRLLFFMKKSLPIPRLLTILFQNHMLSSYPTDLSAEADHENLAALLLSMRACNPAHGKTLTMIGRNSDKSKFNFLHLISEVYCYRLVNLFVSIPATSSPRELLASSLVYVGSLA